MSVVKEYFGRLADGREVSLYKIRTDRLYAEVTDLGAVLVRLETPDRDGNMKDIVLGYEDVEHYLENPSCFGAVVGPSANRIAGASFVIDGEEFHLPANERGNNLHSDKMFYKRLHDAQIGENSVTFRLNLPDGDAGFPGSRDFSVTYTLTNEELRIDYKAISDKKTVINLTNHSYFNLAGEDSGFIGDQILKLNCSFATKVRADLIPTGEIVPVEGTPLDFRKAKAIGKDIDSDDEQMKFAGGYDHNFVIDGQCRASSSIRPMAWWQRAARRAALTDPDQLTRLRPSSSPTTCITIISRRQSSDPAGTMCRQRSTAFLPAGN